MGIHLLAVALGSALGGCLRYLATLGVNALLQRAFPWGTLAVNVAGCLLIGMLHVFIVERGGQSETLRLFTMVGVLGGFTTFSSFSLETLLLVQQGALGRAAGYVAASVVVCLAASVAGMALARAAS